MESSPSFWVKDLKISLNIFGQKLLPGIFIVFIMTQGVGIQLVWDFSCLGSQEEQLYQFSSYGSKAKLL